MEQDDFDIPKEYGKALENISVPSNIKLPNIETNACANCPKANWAISRMYGLHCFCTVKHTNTYEREQDGEQRLMELVTQCSHSYLVLIQKAKKLEQEIYGNTEEEQTQQ